MTIHDSTTCTTGIDGAKCDMCLFASKTPAAELGAGRIAGSGSEQPQAAVGSGNHASESAVVFTEREVSEIEGMFPHAEYNPRLSADQVDGCEFCKGTVDDHKANCVVPHVHALCATVRALEKQLELKTAQYEDAEVHNKGLRERLAEVEQERDDGLKLYNSAWLWVQQRVRHPNTGQPPTAMTLLEMLPLLNQRAIQLCRDKAAKWEQAANTAPIGTFENERLPYLKMRDAVNEIREALEKLT